jgi:hypothetical protein
VTLVTVWSRSGIPTYLELHSMLFRKSYPCA